MGSFAALLLVAAMPVVKLILMSAIGVVLALPRVGILSPTARLHLNKVVVYVFQPALVCGYLAKTLTFKNLVTLWFMPVNVLLTFVIGSLLGWILGKCTRSPKPTMGLVIAACSAGNLGGMPIIIIPATCRQNGSPFGEPDVCEQYGLTYASLSMAIGSVFIWLYIFNVVRVSAKSQIANANDSDHGRALANSPEAETLPSSDCAIAVQVEHVPDPPSEQPDMTTSGNTTDHHPADQSSAPSRDHSFDISRTNSLPSRMKQCLQTTSKKINLKKVLAPSTIGGAIGFVIAMIPPLQKVLFSNTSPLHVIGDTFILIGNASIPTISMILGASLLKGLKGSKIRLSIVIGIIIVKYILLPVLGVLIVKGAVHAGFVDSKDTLYQFSLLLQYALPPALTIGTITLMFGASQDECSVILLWTYAVAPLIFTLWTTFFLWFVSHHSKL